MALFGSCSADREAERGWALFGPPATPMIMLKATVLAGNDASKLWESGSVNRGKLGLCGDIGLHSLSCPEKLQ